MYINTLAKRGTDMLSKRYYCDSYGYCYNSYSGWASWGRWVVFAVCVGAALILFLLFSCITARRRRRAGMQPWRGTGWAAGGPAGHGAASYNPNYRMQQQPAYNPNGGDPTQPWNNNVNPPPAYHTPQNAGYYGGDAGVTQPPAAYKAPEGPPPSHHAGNTPSHIA